MKYIKNYESFRQSRFSKEDEINEEFKLLRDLWAKLTGGWKEFWKKIGGEMRKALGLNPEFDDIKRYLSEQVVKIFNSETEKFFKDFKLSLSGNNLISNIELTFKIISILHNFLKEKGLLNLEVILIEINREYSENTPQSNMIEYVIGEGKKQLILKMNGYDEKGVDAQIKQIEEAIKAITTSPADQVKSKEQPLLDLINKFYGNYFKDLKVKLAINFGEKMDKAFTDKTKELSLTEVKNLIKIKTKESFDTITEQNYKKWAQENDKNQGGNYKVGDNVIYKRDTFKEDEWNNLKDEDKKKPNEGKIQDLIDKQIIGMKVISKIEGSKVSFEDATFTKEISDILMKVEESDESSEAQKNITDNLKKIKNTKKENLPRIAKILNQLEDEEKLKKAQSLFGGDEGK